MKKIIPTQLSYMIDVPHIADEGSLCFMENNNHIPFEMKRIYYIFDVEKNAVRGHHAHKKTEQMLFCIRGSISIRLDDGKTKETVVLDKPNRGIFLDALMWHEMADFSEDTVLLVLASDVYDESDYLRNYEDFIAYQRKLLIENDGQPLVRYYTPLKLHI